jgi:hypothetical protein
MGDTALNDTDTDTAPRRHRYPTRRVSPEGLAGVAGKIGRDDLMQDIRLGHRSTADAADYAGVPERWIVRDYELWSAVNPDEPDGYGDRKFSAFLADTTISLDDKLRRVLGRRYGGIVGGVPRLDGRPARLIAVVASANADLSSMGYQRLGYPGGA